MGQFGIPIKGPRSSGVLNYAGPRKNRGGSREGGLECVLELRRGARRGGEGRKTD